MAKTSQKTNDNATPFKSAGAFLRQKRKAAGYKTQKAYIQALKAKQPGISCSEPYISLIEKGVKIPALKLFNVMAEVLGLTATEKGELLLGYKRVPRDFEFAVRDKLKAAARPTHMDQLREAYTQRPSAETYGELLMALVFQQATEEALSLLKEAPIFENKGKEMQLRSAQIASLSGNYEFASSAFAQALDQAQDPEEALRIQRYQGIHYFQQGLLQQEENPVQALEYYLTALSHFDACLQVKQDDVYIRDEAARCAYNVADVISHLHHQKALKKPAKTRYAHWANLYQNAFGNGKNTATVRDCVSQFFERARQDYAQVLALADRCPLPEKAQQEAVFFHAYVHGKLQRFQEARILLHSVLALETNWLTLFMKAGLSIMEYEATADASFLSQALQVLKTAHARNQGAIAQLVHEEKDRELRVLWQHYPREMEALGHAA